MPSRRPALAGLLFTLLILGLLWAPLGSLHGRALAAFFQNPAAFSEIRTSFAPRLGLQTLQLGLATTFFSAITGIPVGWLLARGAEKWRGLWTVLAAIPLGWPPVLAAAPFFSLAGDAKFPLFPTSVALAACYFPVVAFATRAAIWSVPREEEEAALQFAAPAKVWSGILARRVFPLVLGALGLVMALAFWEMPAPDLLGFPALSSEVYRALNASNSDPALANLRAALVALPLPFFAFLVLWPLSKNWRQFAAIPANNAPDSRLKSVEIVAILALLASPGAILWRFARELDSPIGVWNVVAGNSDSLVNTLELATICAFLWPLLALVLGLIWKNWPRKWRQWALLGAIVPGLFAPLILGVAVLEFYNLPRFDFLWESRLGLTLCGYFARFFPLAVALMWPAIESLGDEPLWAAQNLGATPIQSAFSVVLPLLKNALAGAFALIWALCAGELTLTVLLQVPDGSTLTLPIFNFLHAGISSDVAALCLLLALLCGAAMALAFQIFRAPKMR